jgi:hypothetical protein
METKLLCCSKSGPRIHPGLCDLKMESEWPPISDRGRQDRNPYCPIAAFHSPYAVSIDYISIAVSLYAPLLIFAIPSGVTVLDNIMGHFGRTLRELPGSNLCLVFALPD